MIAAHLTAVQRLRTLGRNTRALALTEFAFTLPIILAMGSYGVELSFLALTNLRVSQHALNLADNASRVGVTSGAGVTRLREADINDVLQGLKRESAAIKLTTNGRVVLSSLENTKQTGDTNRVQRIHWQRCIGLKRGTDFDSHYGTTNPTDGMSDKERDKGTAAPNGMGDPNREVKAYQDSGVMFVEINYQYKPLFGSLFVSPQVIRYKASFVVRDNRDFAQIYNPSPAASPSHCGVYTS